MSSRAEDSGHYQETLNYVARRCQQVMSQWDKSPAEVIYVMERLVAVLKANHEKEEQKEHEYRLVTFLERLPKRHRAFGFGAA